MRRGIAWRMVAGAMTIVSGVGLTGCNPVKETWRPPAVQIVIDSTVPSAWRSAITDAHMENWSVNILRSVAVWNGDLDSTPCVDNVNSVNYRYLAPDALGRRTLAQTVHCSVWGDETWAYSADVTFNSDIDWAILAPVPAGFYDVESVATHEFGHVLGWNNFDYSDSGPHHSASDPVCADNSSRRTMCPAVSAATTYLRSPEPEDVKPLRQAYP